MKIYQLDSMAETTSPMSCVVALGTFDGCHLGHRRVLAEAFIASMRAHADGLVYTFSRSPRDVLFGTQTPVLSSIPEKCAVFREMRLSYAAIEDFEAVRDLSPEAFVSEVLIKTLHAKGAVCGYDYRFGKDGSGDAGLLASLMAGYGYPVTVVPEERAGGEKISSSRIRRLIEDGDVDKAAALGVPCTVTGTVLHGKAIGRTIGIPTANQVLDPTRARPKNGVYASICQIGEYPYIGVTNVGTRPSVDSDPAVTVETHILDYDGDLYGSALYVELRKYLRPQMTFSSLEELKKAILNDAEEAKRFLSPL